MAIFVVAALMLAIFGIYQSGHGGASWTDVSAISRGSVQLSVADVLALGGALVAGIGTFFASR